MSSPLRSTAILFRPPPTDPPAEEASTLGLSPGAFPEAIKFVHAGIETYVATGGTRSDDGALMWVDYVCEATGRKLRVFND